MNQIPQIQLDATQLDRLAAQRQLYSAAKRFLTFQIILSVPCVVIWSGLVVWSPKLKVYAALWGIMVALLDVLVFNRLQHSTKERAAKIQELFDCEVLQLDWHSVKVGRKPDAEIIVEAAAKFNRTDPGYLTLKNWYPTAVGTLPIELARIICQRANCWWDAKLRRRYAAGTVVIVVILAGIVLVGSILQGFTLEKFILAGLMPLLPALILGMRQYNEQNDSAASSDHLKEHAERLWDMALAGKADASDLRRESRELQDEIYNHRRTGPLIFDWIYRRVRRAHEEQMNKSAEALVEEARKALFRRNN